MSREPPPDVRRPSRLPALIRAGRAAVGWSQRRLAREAGLGESTVRDFEAERTTPTSSSLQAMTAALERGGVRIFDDFAGGGIRLLRHDVRSYSEVVPSPAELGHSLVEHLQEAHQKLNAACDLVVEAASDFRVADVLPRNRDDILDDLTDAIALAEEGLGAIETAEEQVKAAFKIDVGVETVGQS